MTGSGLLVLLAESRRKLTLEVAHAMGIIPDEACVGDACWLSLLPDQDWLNKVCQFYGFASGDEHSPKMRLEVQRLCYAPCGEEVDLPEFEELKAINDCWLPTGDAANEGDLCTRMAKNKATLDKLVDWRLKLLQEQDLEPEEDSTYHSGNEMSNAGWESDRSQNQTLSMKRPVPKGDGARLTVPSRVVRRVLQKPSGPQASKNSEASDSEESQAGGVDLADIVPSITFDDLGRQQSSYFTGPALEDPSLTNKAGQ